MGDGGGSAPIRLVASNAYDPGGDGQEHDELVQNATDGHPSTSWETERYGSLTFGNLKDGVGLVLDAGRPVKLRALTVVSDTPGFIADVKAGASSNGPFDTVSGSQTVGGRDDVPALRARARAVLPRLDHAARARRSADGHQRGDAGGLGVGG